MEVIDLSRRCRSGRGTVGRLKAAITIENRGDIGACRSNLDPRDEFLLRQRPRAFGDATPLSRAAWPGVVSGEHARFATGRVTILVRKFLEVPATDLNIVCGIGQEGGRVRA